MDGACMSHMKGGTYRLMELRHMQGSEYPTKPLYSPPLNTKYNLTNLRSCLTPPIRALNLSRQDPKYPNWSPNSSHPLSLALRAPLQSHLPLVSLLFFFSFPLGFHICGARTQIVEGSAIKAQGGPCTRLPRPTSCECWGVVELEGDVRKKLRSC